MGLYCYNVTIYVFILSPYDVYSVDTTDDFLVVIYEAFCKLKFWIAG